MSLRPGRTAHAMSPCGVRQPRGPFANEHRRITRPLIAGGPMPELPSEPHDCPRARQPRPLPDPEAVRLCLIPDTGPPYDDQAGQAARASASSPSGNPRPPDRGDHPSPRQGGDHERQPGDHPVSPQRQRSSTATSRQPATPGVDPSSEDTWPSRFAQVLVETLAGARPPRQIVPWTTEQARNHIQRLGPQLASDQRPRVRRVVTSRPTTDALEMTVIAGFGPQVRAVAVRLDRARSVPDANRRRTVAASSWLCTAVEAA
jgi:Family of unknown function (DUF6459)